MHAIAVRSRDAGLAGLSLADLPYPHAAENDVIGRVPAAGFTRGELTWDGTWTDRGGRDRTPSVPGHEGLADWPRNGTLAEYAAIQARNLAPLPVGVGHAVAAGAVISGLTAWQALFEHAHHLAGQTVLIHGAARSVGSIAVQFARQAGSRLIGTGRAADRDRALGLGVDKFVDLETDPLEAAGEADAMPGVEPDVSIEVDAGDEAHTAVQRGVGRSKRRRVRGAHQRLSLAQSPAIAREILPGSLGPGVAWRTRQSDSRVIWLMTGR